MTSTTSDPAPHVSVLIVGAGPTGLTLAAALTRYGIPLRIVEKKPGLSRFTKASNLMLRSQEALGALGVRMPIEEIGGPMRYIAYEVHGRSLGLRSMMQPDTPYPGVLLCGQNRLEQQVRDDLAKSGVGIEFDTELVAVRQDGDGVWATLRTSDGEASVRADHLVGCDGANGPTRKFTKWDFTPRKTGVAVRQVDCRLAWRRSADQDQMWLFYFTNGFLAVVPLPGGMYRIATHEPVGNLPRDKPDLPEMQAKLRHVTGDPSCRLSDLDWSTHTDLSMGIADGLRDQRIILAGDAGNPILPNGGQGMNVGILDAFNLGWKLASVVSGGPDELLDTYATERLSLRAALEKFQWSSLKYTTLRTPPALRWAMPRILEASLNRGGEAALARVFSQLGENVRISALTLDLAGRRGLRGGDRAPDASVVLDGKSANLFDLVYRGGWTFLAFGGVGTRSRVAEAARAAETMRNDGFVESYLVTTNADVGGASVVYDLDGAAHRAFKLKRPMLYLIRPDGYVGARGELNDLNRLKSYVRTWAVSCPASRRADVGGPGRGFEPPLSPVAFQRGAPYEQIWGNRTR